MSLSTDDIIFWEYGFIKLNATITITWALMLVMFAVGIMNLFWMALIGLFAIVEKTGNGSAVGRLAGAILLVWAAALLVISN